MTNVIG